MLNASASDSLTNVYFDKYKSELMKWDENRGEWLAVSLRAIAENEVIPTRTFPENYTPYQLMSFVPSDVRAAAVNQLPVNSNNPRSNNRVFTSLREATSSRECSVVRSRSYGDPHLIDVSGNRFSFQTVGEFVLVRKSNNVEVQARQQAFSSNFSLNTAIALNVNGDRLCFYAQELPDTHFDSYIRLNGQPVYLTGSTYFLPKGGTLKKSANKYTVFFSSGEAVVIEMRNRNSGNFIDFSLDIPSCNKELYYGVLASGNGREMSINENRKYSSSKHVNKEVRAERVRMFAREYRVTSLNSLFDYQIGKDALFYTDLTYPQVLLSIDDMDVKDRRKSEKICSDLINTPGYRSCIYDQGFLGERVSANPVVVDPRKGSGSVLKPLPADRIIHNLNPGEKPRPVRPVIKAEKVSEPIQTDLNTGTAPLPNTIGGEGVQEVKKPVSKPVTPPKTQVVYKPKPRVTPPKPRPKPVVKPSKPKPTYRAPVVKPKPVPRPKPTPRPIPKPSTPKKPIKKG